MAALRVVVVLVIWFVLRHYMARFAEERDAVLQCRCGKDLRLLEIKRRSAIRRCSDGHLDVRPCMNVCRCGGHLAHGGNGPRDRETYCSLKFCWTCGRNEFFVMRLSAARRRLLKSLGPRRVA